ncbi:MAG: LysR family transcriptional regulator [Pseudomonadota bacterium]
MTLDQLQALEAIVATGTFRGAADRLHKAQSAISHKIRKLEAELEFDLFSRSDYRPKLTPRGEIFFRDSLRILNGMQALKATAAELRSEQEASVTISVSATMPLDPLLEVLGPISEAYPATHIRVFTDMMGGPISRLMSGEADLILATLSGVSVDDVETLPVGSVTIRPVCSPIFEPADFPGVRSIAEMQTYCQVVVADTVGGDFEQSRDVLPGGRRWTVSDFAMKKSILLAGLGWGGMPEHLIEEELASGALTRLDVEGFRARHSEIYAVRKRGKDVGRVQTELWKSLSNR